MFLSRLQKTGTQIALREAYKNKIKKFPFNRVLHYKQRIILGTKISSPIVNAVRALIKTAVADRSLIVLILLFFSVVRKSAIFSTAVFIISTVITKPIEKIIAFHSYLFNSKNIAAIMTVTVAKK